MKIFNRKISKGEEWVEKVHVGGFTHKLSDYFWLTGIIVGVLAILNAPLCFNKTNGAVPDQTPKIPSEPDRIIEKPPEPYYLQYVREAGKRHSIDPDLIHAVILHESKGRVYAKGDAGEFGLMQVLPANMVESELVNPFEPELNIEAGTRYLKKCMNRYKKMDKAISCYNMGLNSKFYNEGYLNNVKFYYTKLKEKQYAFLD